MINIAIDGPAGAGKSYLARQLAKRLGYIYVDTGALYRAVSLYVIRRGVCPTDAASVTSLLPGLKVDLAYADDGEQHVYLNGEDVSAEIRRPVVSKAAPSVAEIPTVRAYLLGLQREMALDYDVVMDGRDIGTIILPKAQVKIFLCADDEARAKRRYRELIEKGIPATLESVRAEMQIRDHKDSTREIAPAIPAADAVILDNSDLDREATVEAAMKIITEKLK